MSHTSGDEMELDRPRSASPNLQPPRDLLVPKPLPHHGHQSHVPTLVAPTPRHERDHIEGRHLHPVPSPIPEVDSRTLTPLISSSQLAPFPQPPSPPLPSQSSAKPTAQPILKWGLGLLESATRPLFPTLVGTRGKSVLGLGASILAAPAVFMLTLTLPVVISHHGEDSGEEENVLQGGPVEGGDGEDVQTQRQGDRVDMQNGVREGRLIDLDSPRLHEHEPTLQYSQSHASLVSYASYASSAFASERDMEQLIDDAEEEIEQELHGGTQFNKYLTAVQLVLGPAFCVAVCFVNMTRYLPWLLFAAFVSGASMSVLVLVFSQDGKHPVVRTALCLIGFAVAMVWIMAIADEVVQVLNVSINHSSTQRNAINNVLVQTFGLIFGLSDAIIGLTIFAVGNSLADFVANVTVARFAPIMGFSACFGGPMLNILLGIGLGGTFVISQTGVPYPVEFDNTLLVSCWGLLALLISTLVFVPWNGFYLSKRWGMFLIFSYVCIMTANILVEIYL